MEEGFTETEPCFPAFFIAFAAGAPAAVVDVPPLLDGGGGGTPTAAAPVLVLVLLAVAPVVPEGAEVEAVLPETEEVVPEAEVLLKKILVLEVDVEVVLVGPTAGAPALTLLC